MHSFAHKSDDLCDPGMVRGAAALRCCRLSFDVNLDHQYNTECPDHARQVLGVHFVMQVRSGLKCSEFGTHFNLICTFD